jgi:hypothetical protein
VKAVLRGGYCRHTSVHKKRENGHDNPLIHSIPLSSLAESCAHARAFRTFLRFPRSFAVLVGVTVFLVMYRVYFQLLVFRAGICRSTHSICPVRIVMYCCEHCVLPKLFSPLDFIAHEAAPVLFRASQ